VKAPQAPRRPTLHLDRDGPFAGGDQVVDLSGAALLRAQPAVDLVAQRSDELLADELLGQSAGVHCQETALAELGVGGHARTRLTGCPMLPAVET
jgi:hypothetical protein